MSDACLWKQVCLEAAERPQWPRVYSLEVSRPYAKTIVGDSGQVLGVQGWALTRNCAQFTVGAAML